MRKFQEWRFAYIVYNIFFFFITLFPWYKRNNYSTKKSAWRELTSQ